MVCAGVSGARAHGARCGRRACPQVQATKVPGCDVRAAGAARARARVDDDGDARRATRTQ
eukprot:504118-Pleurochrysis_carterae.AAC.1